MEISVEHIKLIKIAVLIFDQSDYYCNDKLYLQPLFKKENLIYEEVIWDTPQVDWKQYDAILIRSTCDYFQDKYEKFIKTLKEIEKMGIPLFNPVEVVQWNSKKNYLIDLKDREINVLETIITTPAQINDIAAVMKEYGWTECIVKPAISGGANKTFRLTQEDATYFNIAMHFAPHELFLIQLFAQEIIDEGEWSFIFFDKKFSHCMLSKPKRGDFRVQFFHGGILTQVEPEPWMIKEAQRILEATHFDKLLYARVDVIKRNNKLYVMEIELIEPYLYFSYYPQAAQTFVNAIKKYVCPKS